MVTMPAGSALFLNAKIFHGTMPNLGGHDRRLLAIGYRPAWAGPVPTEDLPQWDPAGVAELPPAVQPLFRDPNLREGFVFEASSKPEGMASDAEALSTQRWSRL